MRFLASLLIIACENNDLRRSAMKLGLLVKVRTGKLDANAAVSGGCYPFFTCSKEVSEIDTYAYDCECVLVAGNGDLNVKYYNGKFNAYQRTYIVERASSEINMRYLYHFLSCYVDVLRRQSIGGVIKYIKLGNLTEADIKLPDKETQERISMILDRLTHLISLRQRQAEKLDELVKARFVEMFGDPVLNTRRLPSVSGTSLFKLSNGKAVPAEKRFDSGIPAYGGNGISWYTDEALINTDTLVVGRVGFQSGNVHFVYGPLWITDNAMYVTWYRKELICLRFLNQLMKRVDFSRYQDAGDLKKITQKPFMKFEYILPSMNLQMEFVNFMDSVNCEKERIQRSAALLETLKRSLMQQYFG